MTAPVWRLIEDGSRHGTWNMALDAAVLETVAGGRCPPTLRFYGWRPPCLSLGRHQPAAAADLGFCERHGIAVVRRPTGGRAVLHHLEVTYAVVLPTAAFGARVTVPAAHRRIAEALAAGLRALGAEADLAPDPPAAGLPGPAAAVPCFRTPAGGEIVAGGRKLAGAALRIARGAILQHGSILLGWDGALQAGCLGLPDDTTLRPHVVTLEELLGGPPDPAAVRAAVARALARAFGARLEPGGFRSGELAAARRLAPRFRVRRRRAGAAGGSAVPPLAGTFSPW